MGAPRMSKEENEALRHEIAAFLKHENITHNELADLVSVSRPAMQGFVARRRGFSPKIAKKVRKTIAQETRQSAEAAEAAQSVRLKLRERLGEYDGGLPEMAKAIEGVSTRELKRYLDASPVSPEVEQSLVKFASNGTHIVKRDVPAATAKAEPAENGAGMTAQQLALSWGLDAIRFVLAQAQRELMGERHG